MTLNETLRDSYVADCERALARWNKIIKEAGIEFELKLPHRGFRRSIGEFAGVSVTPEGQLVADEDWQRRKSEWMPNENDREFVASLMKPMTKPGQFASWIAPPVRGINHQPLDFDYISGLPAA